MARSCCYTHTMRLFRFLFPKYSGILFTLCVFAFLLVFLPRNQSFQQRSASLKTDITSPAQQVTKQVERGANAVLGTTSGSMYFSSNSNSYSNGGVVVLSTNQKSEITIDGYQVSGAGSFTLYKVSKDDLLNYLVYKRQVGENYGSALSKVNNLDLNKMTKVLSFEQPIDLYANQTITMALPFHNDEIGVWFLKGRVNDVDVETMIIRSNLGAIVHEGNNENIFWVQDNLYRNAPDVHLDLMNAENALTNLGQLSTDQEGVTTSAVKVLSILLSHRKVKTSH
jgi:hypothetical protein